MLTAWLLFVALLVPPVRALPAYPPALPTPDTGSAVDSAPVVLTAAVIAPYVAVEKEFLPYMRAHPALSKAAQGHGQGVAIGGASVSLVSSVVAVQQDTAMAALFTKSHYTPAQFDQTQLVVCHAIVTALTNHAGDSTTVAGQNVAFVQAHRPELAADWSLMQLIARMEQQVMQQIQMGANAVRERYQRPGSTPPESQ